MHNQGKYELTRLSESEKKNKYFSTKISFETSKQATNLIFVNKTVVKKITYTLGLELN